MEFDGWSVMLASGSSVSSGQLMNSEKSKSLSPFGCAASVDAIGAVVCPWFMVFKAPGRADLLVDEILFSCETPDDRLAVPNCEASMFPFYGFQEAAPFGCWAMGAND